MARVYSPSIGGYAVSDLTWDEGQVILEGILRDNNQEGRGVANILTDRSLYRVKLRRPHGFEGGPHEWDQQKTILSERLSLAAKDWTDEASDQELLAELVIRTLKEGSRYDLK